jgi:hypothetical protein
MPELTLDSLAEPVREFFRSLPIDPGDAVVVRDGRAVFRIQPSLDDPAGEWTDAKNARRFALIDREMDGTLTEDESAELDSLQGEFRRYRRRVAPLPVGETRRLLEELERKAGQGPA